MQAFGLSHSPRDLSGKDEHRAASDPWRWPELTMSTFLRFPTSWYTSVGEPKLFWTPPCQCVALPSNPWPSCSIIHPFFGGASSVHSCHGSVQLRPPFHPSRLFLFDSRWEPTEHATFVSPPFRIPSAGSQGFCIVTAAEQGPPVSEPSSVILRTREPHAPRQGAS